VEFQYSPSAVSKSIPVARLIFDAKHSLELLRIYASFTSCRPSGRDGVSAYLFLAKDVDSVIICDVAPPVSEDPAANAEAFREMFSPFLALDPTVLMQSMPLPELNSMGDVGNAAGRMYSWSRSTFLPCLSEQVLQALNEARGSLPVDAAAVEVMHLGGAIAMKTSSESAFFHR
jgi:hypothetical protein